MLRKLTMGVAAAAVAVAGIVATQPAYAEPAPDWTKVLHEEAPGTPKYWEKNIPRAAKVTLQRTDALGDKVKVGDTLTYTVTVTNRFKKSGGRNTLLLFVHNTNMQLATGAHPFLAPEETQTITVTYTVKTADAKNGTIEPWFTASIHRNPSSNWAYFPNDKFFLAKAPALRLVSDATTVTPLPTVTVADDLTVTKGEELSVDDLKDKLSLDPADNTTFAVALAQGEKIDTTTVGKKTVKVTVTMTKDGNHIGTKTVAVPYTVTPKKIPAITVTPLPMVTVAEGLTVKQDEELTLDAVRAMLSLKPADGFTFDATFTGEALPVTAEPGEKTVKVTVAIKKAEQTIGTKVLAVPYTVLAKETAVEPTPEPTESAKPQPQPEPQPSESAKPQPQPEPLPSESAKPEPTESVKPQPEPTESVKPQPHPAATQAAVVSADKASAKPAALARTGVSVGAGIAAAIFVAAGLGLVTVNRRSKASR